MIRKRYLLPLIAIVAIAVFIIGGMVMIDYVKQADQDSEGRVFDNVFIEDVAVGGKTKDETIRAVEDYLTDVKASRMTLKAGEHSKKMKIGDVVIVYGAQEAIDQAYNTGRTGNVVSRFFALRKLEREPQVIPIETNLTAKEAERVLSDSQKALERDPKSAYIREKDGRGVIQKEQYGQKIDKKEGSNNLQAAVGKDWDKSPVTVEVPAETSKPEIVSEDLKDCTDIIGTCRTMYNTGEVSRSNNIAAGSKKINDQFIKAGEQFDFSKVIGTVDESHGYLQANVYRDTKQVSEYGGGLSQVTTTLYDAVVLAELKVDERHEHSLSVDFVDLGEDADFTPDGKTNLKFTNDQESPVYVTSTAKDGVISVTVFGKNTHGSGRTTSLESVTTATKNPTETVVGHDATLEKGKTRVQSRGITGYDAELWLVIRVDGKETDRVKVNSSSYASTPTKIIEGTKEPEEEKDKDKDKEDDDRDDQDNDSDAGQNGNGGTTQNQTQTQSTDSTTTTY